MRGKETKRAPPSTDLLVCFPSRTHLALMPKPASSPVRPPDSKHHPHHHRRHHNNNLRLKITTGSGGGSSKKATPLLLAKNKQITSETSEPSSPKVTCAGQIKVRSKTTSSCKNWQSVMEEIEKIHNKSVDIQRKKTSTWMETIGFKREVMQFLTCLQNIRFDFRCFGAFPNNNIISSDDDEEENEDENEEDDHVVLGDDETSPRTWFMLLQENNNNNININNNNNNNNKNKESVFFENGDDCEIGSVIPPPNALMLMRCRSAPAKGWRDVGKEERQKNNDQVMKRNDLRSLMDHEEKINPKENLVLMKYDTDFYKISSDIAKETWVLDGMNHLLSRSRSSKR